MALFPSQHSASSQFVLDRQECWICEKDSVNPRSCPTSSHSCIWVLLPKIFLSQTHWLQRAPGSVWSGTASLHTVMLVEAGVYEHTCLSCGRFGAQGQPAAWATGHACTAPSVSREPHNHHMPVLPVRPEAADADFTE